MAECTVKTMNEMNGPPATFREKLEFLRCTVLRQAIACAEGSDIGRYRVTWPDDGSDCHTRVLKLPDPWRSACLWALLAAEDSIVD